MTKNTNVVAPPRFFSRKLRTINNYGRSSGLSGFSAFPLKKQWHRLLKLCIRLTAAGTTQDSHLVPLQAPSERRELFHNGYKGKTIFQLHGMSVYNLDIIFDQMFKKQIWLSYD